ncbi:hypothetical protein [uncultured Capnocytophaga sp.]|uniref:hypothetical protein n=1 Tax=uncultured Capnocytophaga sp. TaxID=159273 RepID=UPI002602A1FE|nr:hypothetical protein [uncultured Capnocytophaga sp.]
MSDIIFFFYNLIIITAGKSITFFLKHNLFLINIAVFLRLKFLKHSFIINYIIEVKRWGVGENLAITQYFSVFSCTGVCCAGVCCVGVCCVGVCCVGVCSTYPAIAGFPT